MDEILKNIDIEKRDRIINSALKEFSENSFDKASTNNIVKNAHISKGLLFHYFGNKQDLYDKLEEFVIRTVVDTIKEKLDWEITDFFERVRQIVFIKGELIGKYPYIYEFSYMLMKEQSAEKFRAYSNELSGDLTHKVYTYNIDFSLFKEDIDIDKTMNIISWTFERLGNEMMQRQLEVSHQLDFEVLEKETNEYTQLLKNAFYK